ncbi:hypothetical protein C7212DRAFT_340837 [Tuber magnatum]|uniref:Uncharacterized protein n=1 Tax=Tuber magnatum TaxID=42249 RepID=A0A317T4K1_9PEZI|nr:hypothetical protein C7212DRAFT_340837 [Tuber magnatum]
MVVPISHPYPTSLESDSNFSLGGGGGGGGEKRGVLSDGVTLTGHNPSANPELMYSSMTTGSQPRLDRSLLLKPADVSLGWSLANYGVEYVTAVAMVYLIMTIVVDGSISNKA